MFYDASTALFSSFFRLWQICQREWALILLGCHQKNTDLVGDLAASLPCNVGSLIYAWFFLSFAFVADVSHRMRIHPYRVAGVLFPA